MTSQPLFPSISVKIDKKTVILSHPLKKAVSIARDNIGHSLRQVATYSWQGCKVCFYVNHYEEISVRIFEVQITNTGTESIVVDNFEFILTDDRSQTSFFAGHPKDYRFYKEGWTTVSAVGSTGYGQHDFQCDPDWTRFIISNSGNYAKYIKNLFAAESVAVVSNPKTKECLLAGFVTTKNQFSRITFDINYCKKIRLTGYSDAESISLKPGQSRKSEIFMIMTGANPESLLNKYVEVVKVKMKPVPWKEIPTGWCSYYYYYGKETEEDILENVDFLKKNKKDIPVRYIQIDDGYQRCYGDWLETNEKFPHGMEYLAKQIKKREFIPGIWVAPFLVQENSDIFIHHKSWLLKDKEGNLLKFPSKNPIYILDCSRDSVCKWLKQIFEILHRWGYEYFKLDFILAVCHPESYYHNSFFTRFRVYRKGLKTIRNAVGQKVFLLAGTAVLGPDIGLVNGSRISTDVTPYWKKEVFYKESPTIFNVCRNVINRAYYHNRLRVNDPDCLLARDTNSNLSLEEVYTLSSVIILSGGSLFLGDRLEELSGERLEIVKTVTRLKNKESAYPVDRMENEYPQVWFRYGKGTNDNPSLLGLFNWSDKKKKSRICLNELPLSMEDNYEFQEVWTKKNISASKNNLCVELGPHACKLFKIIKGK